MVEGDTGTAVLGAQPNTLSGSNRVVKTGPVGVPVSPRRPRNTLWIIFGLLLVVFSGLATLGIAGGLAARVDVVVANRAIAEGQEIEAGDLGVASISVSGGVQAIAPSQRDSFVGMIAAGPIGEGAVLHPAQFAHRDAEDEVKVIIGAALQPGQYPRIGLRPGDTVRVIEVTARTAGAGTVVGPRELTEAEVVEIASTGTANELLVSLRINESIANLVSESAGQGRVRLALLDAGFDDVVQPLAPAAPAEPGEPEPLDRAEGADR